MTRSIAWNLGLLGAFLGLVAVPAPAVSAQTPSPADQAAALYESGMKAMEEKRYAAAAEAFEKAYALDRDPVLVWNIGYAREMQGELAVAKQRYTEFLAHEDVPGKLRTKASERIVAIDRQLREEEEARKAKALEERLKEELKTEMDREAAKKAAIEKQLREEMKKELAEELQKELEASKAEIARKQAELEEQSRQAAERERAAEEARRQAEEERRRLAEAEGKGEGGQGEPGKFAAVGTHRFGYRHKEREKKPGRIWLKGLFGAGGTAEANADGPLDEQAELAGKVDLATTFGGSFLYEGADPGIFSMGILLRSLSWRRDVELIGDAGGLDDTPRNVAFDLALSFRWRATFADEKAQLYVGVPVGITIDVLSGDFQGARSFDIGPGINLEGHLGFAWFLSQRIGLFVEAGYLFHNFFHGYRMESDASGAGGSGKIVYVLEQSVANLGMVVNF